MITKTFNKVVGIICLELDNILPPPPLPAPHKNKKLKKKKKEKKMAANYSGTSAQVPHLPSHPPKDKGSISHILKPQNDAANIHCECQWRDKKRQRWYYTTAPM